APRELARVISFTLEIIRLDPSTHFITLSPFSMKSEASMIRIGRVQIWLTVMTVATFVLTDARGENLKTESRIPYLHHIPLRDAEGQIISLPAAFDEAG